MAGRRIRPSPADFLRAALARASLRCASFLPLRVTRRLGCWLAPVVLKIPGRARDSTLLNLALCFPGLDERERQGLARRSLAEAIAAMLELGPLWHWKRGRVLSLVRGVSGLERLDAALSAGRGVILLGPHLGAWELVGLYVSSRVPMTTLYRRPRVPVLEGFYRRARERFGAKLVPADAGGVRALYRTLHGGGVVGLLPDQDPGRHGGIFAPFFGVLANTSTLTARLLASTGAVALLAWAERLESGAGYHLHFVEPDWSTLQSGDVVATTCTLNLELERLIRCRPQQYLWSYRRFRHRPAGQSNPYRRGRAQLEALAYKR